MCVSHAVLQIHTHFLTWTNSLHSSFEHGFHPREGNYNSFTHLFPPTHFKTLHRRENRDREGEDKGNPPSLPGGCTVFFRLPTSSQPTMP